MKSFSEGNCDDDARARARARIYTANALGERGALFHAQQPQPAALLFRFKNGGQIKPAAVILNAHLHLGIGKLEHKLDTVRVGMIGDIVHRFLRNPEEIDLQVR